MSIELIRPAQWLRRSLFAFAMLATGCLELQQSDSSKASSCTACHGDTKRVGDETLRAAPPVDLDGKTAIKSMGVGAHQRHLSNDTHAPVACKACHVVPAALFDPGHVDTPLPAEVTFDDLAIGGDRQPTFDHKSRSCAGTYCHRDAQVDWTAPRKAEDACGTCHGLPPALPHPQRKDCSNCHGEIIAADGHFVAPLRHVDGNLDVKLPGKCASCHGTDPETGGPPPDLSGTTDPSARGVGAHGKHLNASETHRAIACTECHLVPSDVESSSHIDGDGRAEISFGTLAKTDRHRPRYDASAVRCSNTYCHGSSTGNWQAPRSSKEACGSCHALPPPAPHTQLTQCSNCHARVVNPDRTIKDASLHVNGAVELDYSSDCSSCHGSAPTGAPPPDLRGNTDPSARGVGAHTQHLSPGATHGPIACDECHVVPDSATTPGHIDSDGVAEVTFGALAGSGGHKPSYDASNAGCNDTYCHGSAKPIWQSPRTSEGACGSCHSLPPPAPHPAASNCSTCHAGIDGSRNFVSRELHVNGRVDLVPMPCNACHGTDPSGAPPPDTQGNQTTTARGVGAHAIHLNATSTHKVVACNECHVVPTDVNAPGHRDTQLPSEVIFGALARTNGAAPSYSATNLTCTGTYCHGGAVPVWNQPRGDADACGSCHGLPPARPHPQRSDCATCHGAVINAAGAFVAPQLHVDGKLDVIPMQCSTCHGTGLDGAPPPDNSGNVSTSARGVGAHQLHLQGSLTHGPVPCTECHAVPTAWNSPGHTDTPLPAEVAFGALAQSKGSSPNYSSTDLSCSGTYCHGAYVPTWTAPRTSDKACGSCHALPPPLPHPQTEPCSLCHGAVIDAQQQFINPALHVDGQVQVVQNCSACHGNSSNAAPPKDLSGSSDPTRLGVGAHQAHLSGGHFGRPLACSECHPVPASITAPGHIDSGASTPADVALVGPGAADSRNPQWNRNAATCSSSWCHGPQDIFNTSPGWTSGTGNLSCTSCHGMPPAAPHPADPRCSNCHADIDSAGNITDRSLHVNGDVDFK